MMKKNHDIEVMHLTETPLFTVAQSTDCTTLSAEKMDELYSQFHNNLILTSEHATDKVSHYREISNALIELDSLAAQKKI